MTRPPTPAALALLEAGIQPKTLAEGLGITPQAVSYHLAGKTAVTSAELLEEIAQSTGGTFVWVLDPAKLPEAFLNLRTTGVDTVTLSVNDSTPVSARLAAGTFTGTVPLQVGENRIVALATSRIVLRARNARRSLSRRISTRSLHVSRVTSR